MHNGPNDPGRESRKPNESKVGQRVSSPHDFKVTLVPIPERRRGWFPSDAPADQPRHILPLLNCWLRNTRHGHWLLRLNPQKIARFRYDACRVADRKNLGIA